MANDQGKVRIENQALASELYLFEAMPVFMSVQVLWNGASSWVIILQWLTMFTYGMLSASRVPWDWSAN